MFPDGRRVVSGSYDQTLKVWDVATGECLATLEGPSYVRCGVRCTFVLIWLRRRSRALQCFRTGGASCLGRATSRSSCSRARALTSSSRLDEATRHRRRHSKHRLRRLLQPLDELAQLVLVRAREALDLLPALEEHEGRHRRDAVRLRHGLRGVDVDGVEADAAVSIGYSGDCYGARTSGRSP